MLLQKTNIEDKLAHSKAAEFKTDRILDEVYQILNKDVENQERIINNIHNQQSSVVNHFNFDLLETKNIFHISQIKKVCIDYRLRFLDSKYFKGDIPQEAIDKIEHLENIHQLELKGFKIMAPSKLFKLKDKDDPLLLVPIGNDYFYLIHKWGNDLHALRKLLMWPFKNIVNLAFLVLLISCVLTFLIPDGLFSKAQSAAQFWVLLFFTYKSVAGIVIFYGFAMGKNFNPAIWNSKYFNA